MGFLESLFKGLQDFAESDTAKRLMEKAEQAKSDEIARTSGRNGLRCTINSLERIASTVCQCEGVVKNIGTSTYRSITVTVVFKNKEQKIVDKQKKVITYGSEMLPGESIPFNTYSTARDVQSASVSVSEYEEL